MTDPMRLAEGEATAFERQLLDAAKRQAPGSALKARMQEGLGLGGATAPVQALVGKSFALGWKANALLALAAVGAAVTVPLVWRSQRGTSSGQPASAVPGTSMSADPVPSSPSSADDLLRAKTRQAAGASGSVMEEIRLLDRVRGAMSAGAPRRALAELQRYDQQYPRGAFGPEAVVLRVEALDNAGDHQAARALGQQFLARHPKNPLADRVAKIVQR